MQDTLVSGEWECSASFRFENKFTPISVPRKQYQRKNPDFSGPAYSKEW